MNSQLQTRRLALLGLQGPGIGATRLSFFVQRWHDFVGSTYNLGGAGTVF